MKVKFKYNVGDTVTLVKLPSFQNMQYGKYVLEDEFKPKEYKIEKCRCVIKCDNTVEVLYNLYAYGDEYIQYDNWIPDRCLEGTPNEHEEDVEFISHDKEVLGLGDVVLCSVFYGDYEKSYLPPEMTFGYVATIVGFVYEINRSRGIIRTALTDCDGKQRWEIVPYLVKNFDETFALEYVKACKSNRFNPITEAEKKYSSRHMEILKSVNLWDKVAEIYNNWPKYRDGGKKKSTPKKRVPKNPLQADIKKLLKSLTEEQKEELKKQLKDD